MTTVKLNGREIDFDAAVRRMDSDICERLNFRSLYGEIGSNAEFLAAYCVEHLAKFGEEFEAT